MSDEDYKCPKCGGNKRLLAYPPHCDCKKAVGDPHAAERERFEAWAKRRVFDLTRFEDADYESEYTELETESAWEAWQARAALSAPAVPPGWVLVPVEPTDAMAAAAIVVSLQDRNSINGVAQYRAMLKAAPSAKEPQT